MMDAPVNKFFDITPIGMIINRIREDINVFRGSMIEAPGWLCDMTSHFIYIMILFFAMESYSIIFGLILVYYIIYSISKPFMTIRKKIDKTGHAIHSPIHSYFHESMRGISVIRAFN